MLFQFQVRSAVIASAGAKAQNYFAFDAALKGRSSTRARNLRLRVRSSGFEAQGPRLRPGSAFGARVESC
jgi:hypothetical protein